MVSDDAPFLVGLGIIDDELEQEAVELRLGQRIDALLLDRILRREHGEARAHHMRLAVDRHTAFLHRFQKRRLRLVRGAVDLVGEQQFGEDRPRSEEHTSELQSLMRNSYAVFCMKKKTKNTHHIDKSPTR